jgi:hypothetical protein
MNVVEASGDDRAGELKATIKINSNRESDGYKSSGRQESVLSGLNNSELTEGFPKVLKVYRHSACDLRQRG